MVRFVYGRAEEAPVGDAANSTSLYWVAVRSSAAGVFLNLKRIAGTLSTPDTAAPDASGAPAAAIGAFRAPKLRRDKSRARAARTARAWRRHTPSLRKSNPGISRRTRSGGACWARLTAGTPQGGGTAPPTRAPGGPGNPAALGERQGFGI